MLLSEAGTGTTKHLHAYLAGAAVPTVLLPVMLVTYCAVRSQINPDIGLERMMQFPLALAPLVWGVWNVVWASQPEQQRLPLGVHGAVVPVVLAPLAVWGYESLGVKLPEGAVGFIGPGIPLMMALYFVLWRTVVGRLNKLLDVG